MIRAAGKFGPEVGILCCDSDRAGIQVTLAHHDATKSDQRRSGEADLFCSKKQCHSRIATCLDLAISLQYDA